MHFTAVCEKLEPYSTTFEISNAKDLKDSKLSSACQLHTASGSSSSSTSSLRRRRLMEITEEEEEEERERKRQSIVQEEERVDSEDEADPLSTPPLSSPEPPVVLDASHSTSPNFAITADRPSFEGVRPPSPAKSDYNVRDGRRLSSQSLRPELYSYSSYTYGKPKVKLGPRPSLETSKRPNTAENFRPTAALPAGFKLSKAKKDKSKLHDVADQEHSESASSTLHVPIAIPEIPPDPDAIVLSPRPNTSSGASMKSLPAMSSKDRMTPEKARLMKAMKMREAKKKLLATPVPKPPPPASSNAGVEATAKSAAPEQPAADAAVTREEDSQTSTSTSQADSSVATDLPTPLTVHTEVISDDVDSHPPSPTIASSEIGESTKASSLSESTDETVQASKLDDPAEEHGHDGDEDATAEEDEPAGAEPVGTGDDKVGDKVIEVEHDVVCTEKVETGAVEPATISPEVVREDVETHDEPNVSVGLDAPTEVSNSIPEPVNLSEPTPLEATTQPVEVADAVTDPVEAQTVEEDTDTREVHKNQALNPLKTADLPESSADSVKSPKSPYGIPVSKFASNDSKSSPTASSTPSLKSKFSLPDLRARSEVAPPLPTVAVIESLATESTPKPAPPPKEKHNLNIAPPGANWNNVSPGSELSDPLLDEELLDELQAATVQEAMIISKSPVSPAFSSSSQTPSPRPKTHGGFATPPHRAPTTPVRGPMLAPNAADIGSSSARRVSAGGAAFIHDLNRTTSNAGLAAKKGMGSSITQRIKALEQLSGKNGAAEEPRPRTANLSSSFISVRKSTVRDSVASTFADRPGSQNRVAQAPTPELSREGSPEPTSVGPAPGRQRSGSVASRMSIFESGQAPRGRPDSIQVTARIVRDPNQSFPKRPSSKDPFEYNTADLKESPLTVDHVKATPEPESEPTLPMPDPVQLPVVEAPKETIQERRQSRDKAASAVEEDDSKMRRTSLSIVKDFIKERRSSVKDASDGTASPIKEKTSRPPSSHQNGGNSIVRRLSVSSRRSSVSRDRDNQTPVLSPSAVTDHSSDETDSGDKKSKSPKSRTSRFMRRLSNSLGPTRKALSPNTPTTVREEDENASLSAAARGDSQPIVTAYMGDVNVQFPDNLLWKRRSLCLDAKGYLILSAIQGAAVNGMEKTGVKRYHLSDFRSPYVPDVDVQELPNSICLDFVDGSGLQFACEDRQGQRYILDGKCSDPDPP